MFQTIIALFILSLTSLARADLILSPGGFLTLPATSDQKNFIHKDIADFSAGAGLMIGMEFIKLGPLTIGIGAAYSGRSGKTQFSNSQATVENLETSMTQISADAGAKFRFVNSKKFKIFAGGGLLAGSMVMQFDDKDFEKKVGSIIGFEESETKSYSGHYFDAGIEYIFSNTSGLRVSARRETIRTEKYENLGKERLDLEYYNIAIQYMHYVNWDLLFGKN